MSVQALYTASTGMGALATKLDVIANNMANINTTAFKKDRANFEDLFYRQNRLPGSIDSDGNLTSTGIEVGLGTRVSSTQTNHSQGALNTTSNPLDLAIEGDGFFRVTTGNGDFFSRAGNFGINANGNLVLGSANVGFVLDPPINIPEEAINVNVSANGTVEFNVDGQPGLTTAGQLQISTFINPDGLLKVGNNLYQETAASGAAIQGNPQDPGFGVITQGALEASNVDPVQELIDLITTQRAFELNSQVVEAGDEALQLTANLRR